MLYCWPLKDVEGALFVVSRTLRVQLLEAAKDQNGVHLYFQNLRAQYLTPCPTEGCVSPSGVASGTEQVVLDMWLHFHFFFFFLIGFMRNKRQTLLSVPGKPLSSLTFLISIYSMDKYNHWIEDYWKTIIVIQPCVS